MSDLIDRQAVIDVLDVGKELLSCALDNMDIVSNDREKFEWGLGLIESYIEDIKDIPPIIEPPNTTWLGSYTPYTCQKCGKHADSKTPYCSFCGRKAVNYTDEDGGN